MGRFEELYRHSLEDPEGFWGEAAARIDWEEQWTRVLDDSGAPFYRWFSGGRLNTCHNALDRHVDGGRGEQLALIYDSPVTDTRRCSTRQSPWSGKSRSAASSCSGRRWSASSIRNETSTGKKLSQAPSRPPAFRSRRRIPCTSSTPRARPVSRRGSCATTAVM